MAWRTLTSILPDASVPRPCRARLVPRRRLRDQCNWSIIALIIIFVFFPVATILTSAAKDDSGAMSARRVRCKALRSFDLGLDCIGSNLHCGVAWNTLFLAVLVGFGTTASASRSRSSQPHGVCGSRARCAF